MEARCSYQPPRRRHPDEGADPSHLPPSHKQQVQASAEALSGTYAVLGRRRARILREELREGSGAFAVHAYLPVEASFGLADEMRRRSSGAASASLLLSHWERLQVRGRGGAGAGARLPLRGARAHTQPAKAQRSHSCNVL